MLCRLRWCHTDLGANILSWPRLIQEDKRFSQLGPIACGLSAEHFDGVLAHHLVDANWTVHHVTNSCLYDHSPSPQVCVLSQKLPCRTVHCHRTCLARQRCCCRCWPGDEIASKERALVHCMYSSNQLVQLLPLCLAVSCCCCPYVSGQPLQKKCS